VKNTQELIDRIIDLALYEDGEDITSSAIFSASEGLRAAMKAKAPGTVAGLEIVRMVFTRLDPGIACTFEVKDGSPVDAGKNIGSVSGSARGILKGERVALNFLQRMSGIATLTAEYVKKVQGTRAKILDTRKTAPGERVLDKMAVLLGGGHNHRMGLWDMALIKDNHIDAAGSVRGALEKVRKAYPGILIEVEARTLDDVRELLKIGADRIMLDNFSVDGMKEAVVLAAGRVELEASGGITLDTVRDVALTGVDYISVGEITHSVKALDISMTIEMAK
jgi:nicotinate-nucleotide pyrophosphorylase (carboxylating)